jgi:hypothetical protein
MKIIDKFKRWWHTSSGHKTINGFNCKIYRYKGEYHRKNGPAIIYLIHPYQKCLYYKYGKLHREDGPAVVDTFCLPTYEVFEYWYNGKKIECNNTEEFKKKIRLLAFI